MGELAEFFCVYCICVANRIVRKAEEHVDMFVVFTAVQCNELPDGGPARFETCRN